MLLSGALGTLAAFVASRATGRLLGGAALLGQWLAALPVVGVTWWCIGCIVNQAQLSVESLLPYTPPQDRDDWSMLLGRQLWSWLVPVWVITIPLTGWWLLAAVDALRVQRATRLPTPRDWRRAAWMLLRDRWIALFPVALVLAMLVEDAFGLRGWGSWLASSVRTGATLNVAAALYASGWLMAAWCLIAALWSRKSKAELALLKASVDASVNEADRKAHGNMIAWLWLMLALVMIALAIGAGQDRTDWVAKVVLPWFDPLLPMGWSEQLAKLLPGLWDDVHAAGSTLLESLVLAVSGGAAASILPRIANWPALRVLDSLCWWPFIVLGMAAAGQGNHHWLSVALALPGMQLLRDAVNQRQQSGCAQAAKALGGHALMRWWRHVLPPVAQSLAAWAMQSHGTALLLLILARALHGPSEATTLGSVLAGAKASALNDPAGVLRPTLLAALAVLCCWQLGRLARPHP